MTRNWRTALSALVAVVVAACSTPADTDGAVTSSMAVASTMPRPPDTPPDSAPGTVTTSLPPTSDTGSVAATTDARTDTSAASTTVVTDEPSTTPPAPSGADAEILACARSIPLPERVALLVWPAVYSSDWDTAMSVVSEHQVGGVVLMEPSGWGPDDVRAGLARLDGAAGRGLIVATDEEGGIVQRLALLGELPSQQEVSEQLDPDEATEVIADHAALVASVGVDMVLGPVVDVVPVVGDVPLTRSRFFTGGPEEVAAYAAAYAAGWSSAGVATVLKHYPGHGGASGDTHIGQGVTAPLDELAAWDLIPFRRLAGTDSAVMVGHLTVPDLTDGVPATQSRSAVDYLRGELGYADALVMTDALGMQAVALPEDQASVRAIAAGIDVVIFTNTGRTAAIIGAIERAVVDGTVSEDRVTEAATRVLRMLDDERAGCGTLP